MHSFLRITALSAVALSALAAPQGLGSCIPLETGQGPSVNPDTPDAFLSLQAFSDAANGASTPTGWTQMYTNQQFTYSQYDRYLGYASLAAYNPQQCADMCNTTQNCGGFTIFYERAPTLNPGPGCTVPSSTTIIKCNSWTDMGLAFSVKNGGQYRGDFLVVIAGSNAYRVGSSS